MTAKNKRNTLPLTEALVFDIVSFLLDNEGSGFSNEISYFIVDNKPRRYTSREVVGILRNRPMFRHAKTSERGGGIKWKLDLVILERYLIQKGYQERFDSLKLDSKVDDLKGFLISKTEDALKLKDDNAIADCYEALSEIWG